MRKLSYERFDQLILVAASNHVDTQIHVKSQRLLLDFTQYVKSQLHLNVVTDLFKREIITYANALRYCEGNSEFLEDALKVLSYFYRDVCFFLIHNPSDIICQISFDKKLFKELERKSVSVLKVKNDLSLVLQNIAKKSALSEISEILTEFEYSSIFDEIEDLGDVILRPNNFAVASILKNFIDQRMLVSLEEIE